MMLAAWVCLSLLQIPLPVMHHHAEIESSVDLAVHMHFRHVDEADEYHWHLVLPRDLGQPEDCPSESTAPDSAIAAGQTNVGGVGEQRIEFVDFSLEMPPSSALSRLGPIGQAIDLNRTRLTLHDHVSPAVHACAVLCVFRA